jgi:KaiC/GvpD/RAD55 family RecA-like ATPase
MSCAWFSHSLLNGYNVITLLGEPGAGKTTAALHIVAYDLTRRGAVKTYDEALVEASARLFLGASTEELVEFLKAQVRQKKRRRDWLIIDDAALGFLDVESTHAWSAIMDALKVARNALAERGVIVTATARGFVAKRLAAMAKVVYVARRKTNFNTMQTPAGACLASEVAEQKEYVVLKRIEWMVKSQDTLYPSEAKLGIYSYIVGLIPIDRRFAMPPPVEEAHIEARRRRVETQLEKALELLRRKKKARESDQIE